MNAKTNSQPNSARDLDDETKKEALKLAILTVDMTEDVEEVSLPCSEACEGTLNAATMTDIMDEVRRRVGRTLEAAGDAPRPSNDA